MKKFALTLIACLAIAQSSYAATSALTESLLEYEAITNAIGTDPNFQNIIPVTEFIIDIKRLTRQVDITGTVKYEIDTRVLTAQNDDNSHKHRRHKHRHHKHKHRHNHNTNTYVAVLNVAPNPGIGPNIVTVVSITQIRQTRSFLNPEQQQAEVLK
jgi:hypothetical protein